SVSVIMDALEEFKQVLGLVPSIPKSTAYFCNVPNAIKASILNSMPFVEGVLPSILSSMHIYWASVFILPSRIVHDLEQLMRGFLWCQWEMKKGKAKVAWDSVCMPKHEGGLGIRRIEDFNIALMANHIWSIFTHRESLWVHTYKLKGRSFWDVPCRGDASWGWRKLLQIRSTIRPFIWHKINNGKSTSVWFDRWTYMATCGMDAIPPHLRDVVAFIVPLSKGKTVVSIISRIVVAATSYYIWLERNGRLFQKKTSTPGQIVDVIFSTVRLKLVTFKFKKMSTKSRLLLDQWKILSYCIVHDGSTK
ncbi:hypothetical protein Tco_0520510, partial [Tanacetum coccineum]